MTAMIMLVGTNHTQNVVEGLLFELSIKIYVFELMRLAFSRKISVEKFKRKYGLKIQYNLKQGLLNTIKWYIKNDHKQNSL